jgi:hypothetical protein
MKTRKSSLVLAAVILAGLSGLAPDAWANSIVTLDEYSPTELVVTLDGEPVDVENTGPHAWNVLLGIPTGPSPAQQSILSLAGWPEPHNSGAGNFIGGYAFLDSGIIFWGLTVVSGMPAAFGLYPENGFVAQDKVRLTDAHGEARLLDVQYTDHTGLRQSVPDSTSTIASAVLACLALGFLGRRLEQPT